MKIYIDRQAAIDALGERPLVWTSDNDYALGERNQYDIDRIAIETVPSADVQPVQHGKWIKAQRKGIISYADGYAECNKCHEVSYLGWNDKYCRNCGARMDGEQDVHSK